MKRIKQFRYYNETDVLHNSPPTGAASWESGSAFNSYFPILQLGIQSLPGTKFYLNNSYTAPIIIGPSGIFELELNGDTQIMALAFDAESMTTIGNVDNGYVIVDVIYEAKEEDS